jgi:hypothetical protein
VKFCSCLDVLKVKVALSHIKDEVEEVIEVRSLNDFLDEMSDVAWGVGRLLGALLGVPYVRFPGDRRHAHKVRNRMEKYGCVRSERFLREGRCPNS